MAPHTLARRDRAFFYREFSLGLEFILTGTLAIVGAVVFGWSVVGWLFFLIVGAFTGIATDTIKLWFLRKPIYRYADESADDQFVGLVSDALRSGEREIPLLAGGGKYRPLAGLLFDLVFAPVSTLMIFFTIRENGFNGWEELFGQKYFVPALVGFCGFQLAQTIWQIVSFRFSREEAGPVKILLGGRGAGLFLLFFLIVLTNSYSKDRNSFTTVLYAVNGLLIVLGLINTVGLIMIRNECRWLREYLRRQEGP